MFDLSTTFSIIAVLISAAGIVKAYGKKEGNNDEKFKAVGDTLNRHERYHSEHYQHAKDDERHFQDMEMHWTGRERDQLSGQIREIKEGQDKILELLLTRRLP